MSCELWADKLEAFVDDEGPRDDLDAVERHLASCPDCARDALSRMQLKRRNQVAAERYAPSPEFRLRVAEAIGKDRRPLGAMAWRAGLIATAAALILIAVCAFVGSRQVARERTVAELLDLHVTTLASANPVDVVSSDRHTVKPWFQGKLPFTFSLPELANTPFKLVGGKLAYFHQNLAAQLLFAAGKHQISVFIVQDQGGPLTGLWMAGSAHAHGFSIEIWSASGLRYAVISDANSAEVHALSSLLRASAQPQ